MCKAIEYTNQLIEIYDNIENDFNTLKQELSQVDLYQQDILHIIESTNFNASEGYKLAKMIKDAREKRRVIKNELEPMQSLKSSFIDKNISNLKFVAQSVKNKDNILKTLTEEKIYQNRIIGNVFATYKGKELVRVLQDRGDECLCLRRIKGRNIKTDLKKKDLVIKENN